MGWRVSTPGNYTLHSYIIDVPSGLYAGKHAGWNRGKYHTCVSVTTHWHNSSIKNDSIHTHKWRIVYHHKHPIGNKVSMLPCLKHKVLFLVRKWCVNWLLPGSVVIQRTRRCSNTVWFMYTVIFPIWNFLSIFNFLLQPGAEPWIDIEI